VPQQPVRLSAASRSKRVIVAAIVAVVVAAVVAFILFGWRRGAEPMEKNEGCAKDIDCGAGRICALNGCLPLISSERASNWRADLAAQLSPKSTWHPRPTYGEKWVFADVCPIPTGTAAPLEEGRVSLVHQTRVFEILADKVRIHVQKRERGARWLEAMRLVFPIGGPLDLKRACASAEVSQAEVARGRTDTLSVALKQTVPAGALASATVSVETELPPAGRDGLRTLKIPLEPVADGAIAVTVAAVPLGANIARMGGPAPARQRLLSGFVAYYWRHSKERGTVAIAFDLRAAGAAKLSLDDIKP
jgi:hypothetical protein